jgi:hypothetical protein
MDKERGSDVLRRMHGGAGANVKQLEGLYRTIDELNLKVIGWQLKGTPQWERVEAVIQVPTARVGQAVEKLVNLEQLAPNLHVFPYGIPVPDIAIIELEAQER